MTASIKKRIEPVLSHKTLVIFIAIALLSFFHYQTLYGHSGKRFLVFSLFSLALTAVITVIYFVRKHLTEFRSYIMIMLVFGMTFVFIHPLFIGTDETLHFYRAFEVSEGGLVSQRDEGGIGGHYWPDSMVDFPASETGESFLRYHTILDKKDIEYHPDGEKVFVAFPSASLYSPVQYIPQVIGISLARLFTSRLIVMFYAGRVTNLLAVFLFYVLAMKFMPDLRRYIFLIFMNPMNLFLAASYSSDGITTAAGILLVCLTLKLACHEDAPPVRITHMLALGLLCILISLCKITYLPFALIIFIIPAKKYSSTKAKYLFISIAALVCIVISALWLLISSSYLVSSPLGSDPAAQVQFLLHSPVKYISVMIQTLNTHISTWTFSLFGVFLGNVNIGIPQIPLSIFIVYFAYILLGDNRFRPALRQSTKRLSVFILITTLLLIFTSLYVQFTQVGSDYVQGVQARYFIPILIFLPFLIGKDLIRNKDTLDLQCQNIAIGTYIPIFISYVLVLL